MLPHSSSRTSSSVRERERDLADSGDSIEDSKERFVGSFMTSHVLEGMREADELGEGDFGCEYLSI